MPINPPGWTQSLALSPTLVLFQGNFIKHWREGEKKNNNINAIRNLSEEGIKRVPARERFY